MLATATRTLRRRSTRQCASRRMKSADPPAQSAVAFRCAGRSTPRERAERPSGGHGGSFLVLRIGKSSGCGSTVPVGHGRSALLRALSAVELCRQFVPSCSRAYRTFLSYNKRSLESLLKWLRSLIGPAGLRVLKDWRGQRRRRSMTCGTEKLRAGGGKCSE